MKQEAFSLQGFVVRSFVALTLVFATYNPEGYSYYHWALVGMPAFSVAKAFLGVVLLIGWATCLRATLHSLGMIGTLLAGAFFGTLLWLASDQGLFARERMHALAYIVLLIVAGC